MRRELSLRGIKVLQEYGRLFLCEGEARHVVFAQDTWNDVEVLNYSSISDAADKLREKAARYFHYTINNHRRGELVLDKLHVARTKLLWHTGHTKSLL